MPQPPLESPQPDAPGLPEEKTDPGRSVTIGEMRHSNNVTRVIIGAVGIFVGGGGFASVVAAASLVRSEARAQAKAEIQDQLKVVATIDAGQKGLEARMNSIEPQVTQLRTEVYQQRMEQYESAQRQREDMRALQDVILNQRPSPRLSKPLPPPPSPPAPPPVRTDGGPP